MPPPILIVTLELALDGSALHGTLRSADGPPTPFAGWMQLAGDLEALTRAAASSVGSASTHALDAGRADAPGARRGAVGA